MNADHTHDDAELSYQDRAAPSSPVRGCCWPLPSDGEEAQLALPAGDCRADDEAALAGAVHTRRRRPHRRAQAVLPPLPREPGDPVRAFDERHAASLACAEPGGSGHPTAADCIPAILAAERTLVGRRGGD